MSSVIFVQKKPENRDSGQRPNRQGIKYAIICLLLAVALVIAIDGRQPCFYMTGGQEIETAYREPFEDPGIVAVLSGRLFGDGKRQLKVKTDGTVNPSMLGEYELSYSVRYMLRNYRCTRTVIVKDMKAPEISLFYRDGYRANWLDGYEEEGYRATDDVDGDITGRVTAEETENGIRYTVSDLAGNRTSIVRNVDYEISRPELILNGEKIMQIPTDFYFQDPGCTARDRNGNDLTEYVQVSGKVIPYEAGSYSILYSVVNGRGSEVRTERTVTVVPRQRAATVSPESKTVYLTFDDGPGPYTDQLLDILKQYDVKATFFVTCAEPDYFDCIGRAFREGHSVGIHSASHQYEEIYASEEAFFQDFNEVQKLILQQTGACTNIFRFPGGSSNTVSEFNPGIMTRLARDLNDMGFQYFDWDIKSGDAGETTDTDEVFRNVTEGIEGRRTTVVLQHDIKQFSVAAVESIIQWGLDHGYEFRALDITSPAAHLEIEN